MSTTVVISQIAPLDDNLGILHVKGTVGGTPYLMNFKNQRFDPVGFQQASPASAIAAAFLAQYNAVTAAFSTYVNSQTVNLTELDNRSVAVVFGSTPYAFVGYETIEVTATVNTVSTVLHVSQDMILEHTGSDANRIATFLARRLFLQSERNTAYAAMIASFTL